MAMRASSRTTPPMRTLCQLFASFLLCVVSSAVLAQQALIVADDGTKAIAFRSQVGKVVTFVCPSSLRLDQYIWGTDVYMDESAVCAAAVHAGVLAPGTSGQVTIVMGGETPSLQGMQRNGVTSSSYGPWSSTYSFINNSQTGQIDWYTTYDRVPDDFHAPITVLCPPKGHADTSVWGTDVYSASSSICLAAVHAGIITLDAGGRVTATLQSKQETFVASLRNGILTNSWTGWNYQSYPQPYRVTPGAMAVTAPTSAPAVGAGPRQAPITSSASSSPGPRTMTLAGFIAAGSATPIVPRTMTLTGFTASGTSASMGPRNITLAGFTAAGTAIPIMPRTITLSGFSATGNATSIVPRTISITGWNGVGAPTTP
jgi:hypothetical protein